MLSILWFSRINRLYNFYRSIKDLQRLLEVANQVIRLFQTDGQPEQARGDAHLSTNIIGDMPMGGDAGIAQRGAESP